MPTLVIFGGPNGAGKSTHTKYVAQQRSLEHIDPDHYVAKLKATGCLDTKTHRHLIKLEVEQLLEDRTSFIFESNLHEPESYDIIRLAKQHGFRIELSFLCIDNLVELHNRVAIRKENDGHDVPVKEIDFRYTQGLKLLPGALKMFDKVELLDSSSDEIEVIVSITKKAGHIHHSNILPKWTADIITEYLKLNK